MIILAKEDEANEPKTKNRITSVPRVITTVPPGLDKNPAYWGLYERCLDEPRPLDSDDDSELGIYLGAEVLAGIEGKQHLLKNKNYSGIQFLEAYKQDVAPQMEWTEHSYRDHKARRIIKRGIPEELLLAYACDLRTPANKLIDRVWLETGLAFTPKTKKAIRVEDERMALERLSEAGCAEARQLMSYLNSLPQTPFTKILSHIPEARRVAAILANPITQSRQFEILRAIEDQCKPVYAPSSSARSVRLFATNDSIPRLNREVRQVLCQDWVTLDLAAAQLAIAAKVWNVPVVQDFLKTSQSVWKHLSNELGLSHSPDDKSGLKKMLYSLLFGGIPKGAIERARKEFFPDEPDLTDRFLKVPLIRALYKARTIQLKAIRREGGAKDAFGNWIPIPNDDGKPNPRSALACQAQSYEMKLLWPVFDAARQSSDFSVVLYLFDGVCITVKDARRVDMVVKRLQLLVNDAALELDIVTRLEGHK